jgi:hypothetical protein
MSDLADWRSALPALLHGLLPAALTWCGSWHVWLPSSVAQWVGPRRLLQAGSPAVPAKYAKCMKWLTKDQSCLEPPLSNKSVGGYAVAAGERTGVHRLCWCLTLLMLPTRSNGAPDAVKEQASCHKTAAACSSDVAAEATPKVHPVDLPDCLSPVKRRCQPSGFLRCTCTRVEDGYLKTVEASRQNVRQNVAKWKQKGV